jgi:tetratricopeptide (TPR) repeat protein
VIPQDRFNADYRLIARRQHVCDAAMTNVGISSRRAPAASYDPRLIAAAAAMNENRLHEAEPLLRALLKEDPFDVRAIRMFAELAGRIGRYTDAENLLRRAIELAPDFTPARANLALVLYRTNRAAEALDELQRVTADDPDNPGHANLQAAAFGRIGEFDEALALYELVLKQAPDQPRVWMSYGHMLKTVGRQADGIAAYRRALDFSPTLGEAWWSLANLKTVRFTDQDIATMRRRVKRRASPRRMRGTSNSRWARLSKTGARWKRPSQAMLRETRGGARIPYRADETERKVDAMIATATPALFAAFDGAGARRPIPSSSWACRVPAPRWSSRSRQPQPGGGPANCPISRCWRGMSRIIRRGCPRCPPRNCARWANSISSGRASSGTRPGRSSSTRCPTTGCMCR